MSEPSLIVECDTESRERSLYQDESGLQRVVEVLGALHKAYLEDNFTFSQVSVGQQLTG